MSKQSSAATRPTFRSRLFLNLIIPYILLILTVLSLSGWFFYSSAKEALDAELSRRLVGVANLVARSINPKFLLRVKPGDEKSSLYLLILGELKKIQEATRIKDIHLFGRDNRMIVDLDGTQSIGEENLLLQIDAFELEQIWKGGAVSSVLYRGRDGQFYKAGYAPIPDETGEVIAGVGVEVGADFMSLMARMKGQFIWITIVTGASIVLISFLLSRSMIRPIQLLASATERLGEEGVYPKVDLRRQDELGDLGNHFNRMIGQIKTKDELLQKRYDEEKARAEELEGYSRTLLKSIPSGVLGVNLGGVVTSCNPAAEAIIGIPASSILGRDVEAALGPFSYLAKCMATTLFTGETFREEFSVEEPLKGRRWIGVMTSLLKDHQANLIGATAVFSDLTEVRNLQEEVQLKRQMVLLGELSAGMAHEIRNPLAAIQALVELLARKVKRGETGERGDRGAAEGDQKKERRNLQGHASKADLLGSLQEPILKEEVAGLAREVVSEVGHLNRFVTEFLKFARLPVLQRERVEIEEIIDGALALVFPAGKRGDMEIRKNIPEGVPPVFLDPIEFRRVLFNLIQNAVQAMDGKGELGIQAENSGEGVRIRISDTGPGIPEGNREKIFHPFFTTKRGGTGLGLAISHRIVTAHGGTISFERGEKKGTVFVIQIPTMGGER